MICITILNYYTIAQTTIVDSCKKNNNSTLLEKDQKPLSTINDSILIYINAYRKNQALPPLQLDTILCSIATKHSARMSTKLIPFGHYDFEKRMKDIFVFLPNTKASSENVAYGKLSAAAVVNGWINSPPHQKNIKGNYNYTGIGVAKDSSGIFYFTQIFIRKNASTSPVNKKNNL